MKTRIQIKHLFDLGLNKPLAKDVLDLLIAEGRASSLLARSLSAHLKQTQYYKDLKTRIITNKKNELVPLSIRLVRSYIANGITSFPKSNRTQQNYSINKGKMTYDKIRK